MKHARRRFRRWFQRFRHTRPWLLIRFGAVAIVAVVAVCLVSLAMSHALPFS